MDAIVKLAYAAAEKQAGLFGEGQSGAPASASNLHGGAAKTEMLSALERLRQDAVSQYNMKKNVAGDVGRATGTGMGRDAGTLLGGGAGLYGGIRGRNLLGKGMKGRMAMLGGLPLLTTLLGRMGGATAGGHLGQSYGESSIAPMDKRLSKNVTAANAPDVISALTAKQASDLEKQANFLRTAGNWMKQKALPMMGTGMKRVMQAPFTAPSKVPGALPGARQFSGKRTLGTLGGLGAAGYGGYGAHQFHSVASGNYDKMPASGDPSEMPGWRRAGRATGQRSFMGDFFRNPGRTLAESFGYGEEGPQSYQKNVGDPEVLRTYRDPITGEIQQVTRQNKQTQWRPDAEKARTEAAEKLRALQEQYGDQVFEGMDLPESLGQRAARVNYSGLPTPGPLTRDYSMYNYGL